MGEQPPTFRATEREPPPDCKDTTTPPSAGLSVMRPVGIEPTTFRSGGKSEVRNLSPPRDKRAPPRRFRPRKALMSTGGDTRPLCKDFATVCERCASLMRSDEPELDKLGSLVRAQYRPVEGSPATPGFSSSPERRTLGVRRHGHLVECSL